MFLLHLSEKKNRDVQTANMILLYRQGAQGTYDSASKMSLAAEFDTENADEAIERILKEGTMQTMEVGHFIHQIQSCS